MTQDEQDAYQAVYGERPLQGPAAAKAARDARAKLNYAATTAGVQGEDIRDSQIQVEALSIEEVTSATVKDALLGVLALSHARVLSGAFDKDDATILEKTLALVADFKQLAEAVDTLQRHTVTVPAALRAVAGGKARPASEQVERLRALLNKAK